MRLKLGFSLAIVAASLASLYAGSALTIRYYLPVYDAPLLAVNAFAIKTMDDCLDRDDFECFRVAFGLLIERESIRADNILEHGISNDMEEEVREHFLKLRELRQKYDPDA